MFPNDFGPIYTETDLSRFPVEPWNTISNFAFLLIVVYWSRRTRFDLQQHPLIVQCLPVLFVGFIGGTLYHATRSHWLWLLLDFGPIFVAALLATYYFWQELLNSYLRAACVLLAWGLGLHFIRHGFDLATQVRIGIGYCGLALGILLPAYLYSLKNNYCGFLSLSTATLSFIVAICFRQLDRTLALEFFPMGTHFLWHLFGALATFCLMRFIYLNDILRQHKLCSSSHATGKN